MRLKTNLQTRNVLCISDMHVPYEHKDAMAFLRALKKKYKFDLVVNMGDLLDFHNISFHKSDPDLSNAGDELTKARAKIAVLEALFPKMYVIGSNHGDLPLRRFFDAGLPRELLRSYGEIYQVGPGWKFIDDLTMLSGKDTVYFCHGLSKDGLKLAMRRGYSVVQGHYHTEFNIKYGSNPQNLLFSLQTGCLIDPKSLAFSYGRLHLERPIIGCAGILGGRPVLFPMQLTVAGRWNGVVP